MADAFELLDGLTRPERRTVRTLLVRTTAASGDPDVRLELPDLLATARVDALPAAAAMHRVSGSVLRGLDGVAGVPDDVRRQLAAVKSRSAIRHMVVTGALSQAGRALDAGGLAWAVMKGPVVAAHLYPDVGDRSYADLDLLVARRDFARAMQLLEELGYENLTHDWALAEQMLAGEVGLRSSAVHVDLHWHIHYAVEDRRPFGFQPDAMVDRARRVDVSRVAVPTLDPVDTLITLAFHAARSDGHRLMWLKDVERAVAVDEPDLDELVRRCRAYGCGPPVGLILGRARNLLGADIPDEIVRATLPRALREADRAISRVEHPVQLHERDTITRAFTRSVKSSTVASFVAVPDRGVRSLRRRLRPHQVNESDDVDEKRSYLDAVAHSTEGRSP